MTDRRPEPDQDSGSSVGSTLVRSAKFALITLGLLLAGIAIASWFGGDTSTLPFDYDGFD